MSGDAKLVNVTSMDLIVPSVICPLVSANVSHMLKDVDVSDAFLDTGTLTLVKVVKSANVILWGLTMRTVMTRLASVAANLELAASRVTSAW